MKTLRSLIAGAIALAAVQLAPASAQEADWRFGNLEYRRELSVDGAQIATQDARAPMLLRLSPQQIAVDDLQDGGADIRFATAGGEPIAHYVERLDRETGIASVWVSTRDLGGEGRQSLYLYYGGNPGNAPDAGAMFDEDDLVALDFSEGAPALDRTGRGNNASGSATASNGFAGLSASFNGAQSFSVPDAPALRVTNAFTLMLWVKPSSSDGAIARRGQFSLDLQSSRLVARVGDVTLTGTQTVAADAWSFIAVRVAANGEMSLFVNGEAGGEAQGAQVAAASAGPLEFGQGFSGQIDNVRYASVARSPAYIRAAAALESPRSAVTWGSEQQHESAFELQYFVTVVENVTIEGWVVIALCALLLGVAIMVMVSKFGQVGRIERANRAFERAYAGDASLQSDTLRSVANENAASTLGQLYSQGVSEIERMGQAGSQRLSAAGVEAVRARLDGVLTNQSLSLSERLVLLTLAVSGGPFLGLLGTVVGVMITFAAIAAEGNVDVNAIAPGVAAALLATAAGLAAAIPALFGYNMIVTRVKRINAASRAFSDALVARIAHQYGE